MNLREICLKVAELEIIRGFADETIEDKKECFKEESKEFLDALDGNGNVAHEGIDVIIVVIMIFLRRKIDPVEAFLEKYNIDKMRGQ